MTNRERRLRTLAVTGLTLVALATVASRAAVAAGSESAAGGALCAPGSHFVETVYRQVYAREPNPGEMARGVAALVAGLPRQEVIRELFRSDAYAARTRTREEAVRDLFETALEREADASEAREWTALSARVSREGLVDALLASPPFAARVALCRR